jgi:uncharacterized protein (DUF1800 family)
MTDSQADAALALHRFGMGPRPGSIARLASDPRGALLAELARPETALITDPDLLPSAAASRAAFDDNAARRARQITAQRAKEKAERDGGMAPQPASMAEAQEPEPLALQILAREAKARFDAVAKSDIGFAERLVWFWSNHFAVATDKVPAMAGGYEREAIRPHVLGRFADMLQAVESHPAMLFYLDNAASMGPNSVAGINRSRGLNENLAREILELHTLGVRTGYTQDDVTRFAEVLTGWTIVPQVGNPDHGAEFTFNARLHEPGPQVVMTKTYAESGIDQGRTVLADLARHPATARHVATKLARHFVADPPPPVLVDRLETAYRDTDGDLKAVTTALITSGDAWARPARKLKRPAEWVAATLRATGLSPTIGRVLPTLALLGEPLWRPAQPTGFSDDDAVWADGLPQRLDIASSFAARNEADIDPEALLETALGPLASTETRQTVARAATRAQAIALVLMSPEFQRR